VLLSDGVEAAFRAARIGVRHIPGDGLPAVGPAPGIEGLYLAVMHSGVTLAPIVGRLAAEEILGKGGSTLLDGFRPARFR
jgi:glycine/D-amino acid oxidase-like deaminating enzyme